VQSVVELRATKNGFVPVVRGPAGPQGVGELADPVGR
jgi:hypothetical protein